MLKILLFFILPVALATDSTDVLLDYITKVRRGAAFDWLAELCDDFGHRKTGSVALENAIDHVVEGLRKDGLAVHTEPVPGLPNWIRGNDNAFVVEPRLHRLSILALDGSPPGQVQAEVVVLHLLSELETVNVKDKIVLFAEKWLGYKDTVAFRSSAKKVAAKGALAVLIKSVTPFSIGSPHTGFGARGSTIPAACVTLEEADMIERWVNRGKTVKVKMDIVSMEVNEPIISRNVVFDIKGSQFPNEIVLLSGHIDSWDVGQGAMDDGGGIASVHEAILAIHQLSIRHPEFRPKRTIRGVFWTAEEQGMLGSRHYFNEHYNKTDETFIFVSETDQGAFRPFNLHSRIAVQSGAKEFEKISEIVKKLNIYGFPLTTTSDDEQGDVQPFADAGVPSAQYRSDRADEYYFNFHHTQGDYMTIFKDGDLEATSAIFAALAHNIANMDSWN
ncbi:unnamed protein product [Auanema sp. JU1783]|nr:unnamed protein product [Auanema sp. JU1783]